MISSSPNFQRSRNSSTSLETVVAALKSATTAADVWVLHEIDPQALLRRGGIEIAPARQLLFFHPRYMKRLLDADPAAGLEAPLKFLILTDGTGAVVRWFDPVASFGRYDNEALRSLGLELSVLCQQIADAALAGSP
jgi:uncharacterized protein (DUF302 family)